MVTLSRATVLTPGGQELALESESTTLKPASRWRFFFCASSS